MPFDGFSERTLRFLTDLSQHNEQAWFEAHLEECERAIIQPAKEFVSALGPRLRELDPKIQAIPRVRGSVKALERRQRFPRAGTPRYKETLDVWFWSGKRQSWDNSGFFVRLTPSRLTLAAGMIEFQKETLARYRANLLDEARGQELAAVVDDLKTAGYLVLGEGYKKTPPGVPADHPRAALTKHRGLFTTHDGEHPPELGTARFVDFCHEHFARMAALHRWLVELRG